MSENLSPDLQKVAATRWSAERARLWQQGRPWRVGCNFLPSSAGNQLEMWQAASFDPGRIDRELGWLAGLGMNSVRVYLHDLLWEGDGAAFLARLERFLDIAHRHGMSTLFVFFDSCWHPFPLPGKQRDPEPGVHNSIWVQSPGVRLLRDASAFSRLEAYVTGVMGRFRDDPRIEAWDIWNEPDNDNAGHYGHRDLGAEKSAVVLPLLAQAFQWARKVDPIHPLTSAVWIWKEKVEESQRAPLQQFQLAASDVLSFHNYQPLEKLRAAVQFLRPLERPLLCTEYLARSAGSAFESVLPFFQEEGIAAYNWGAVAGRSQTIYSWSTWQLPALEEPDPWHHDILREDGSPYRKTEADLIRSLAGSAQGLGTA